MRKSTNLLDVNNNEIYEGSELLCETMDGDIKIFKVEWSDFREDWKASNDEEIYDIAPSSFNQCELISS